MAVSLSVKWMSQRAEVPLPTDALTAKTFDVSDQLGANPCKAIRIDNSGETIWAGRLDHPDKNIFGRTWVTEIFVRKEIKSLTRFGAQLTCVNKHYDVPFAFTRPNFVRDVLSNLSAEEDGWQILEEPTLLENHDASRFEELIYSPSRRLPVIVAAETGKGSLSIDLNKVSRRLGGATHILRMPCDISNTITRSLGRKMSVFDGAVRVYMPGLTEGNENPYQHPLWRASELAEESTFISMLAARLLPEAFFGEPPGTEFIKYSSLREVSTQQKLGSDGAKRNAEEAFRYEIHALATRNRELLEEISASDSLAQDEQDRRISAESEIEKLKAKILNLENQISLLKNKVNSGNEYSSTFQTTHRHLSSYADLEDWADEILGDKIIIHDMALKDCRKHGNDAMLEKIEEILLAIRDYVVPAKFKGGRERLNLAKEKLLRLGVEDSPCFADRNEAKRTPGYTVKYNGETRVLNDHLKYGNGTDNSNQVRVYYFLDEQNSIFVIGKMPSHLPNNLTN